MIPFFALSTLKIKSCFRKVVSSYPIDPARVGVMGTNYGGFLAIKMVANRNRLDMFKCGVVRSPVVDWKHHGKDTSPFLNLTILSNYQML